MGIKFTHDHEPDTEHPFGGRCFAVRTTHPFKRKVLLYIGGKEYAAGLMGYTGHWYIFDTATGEEVASIPASTSYGRLGFLEHLMRTFPTMVAGEMREDPDCAVR